MMKRFILYSSLVFLPLFLSDCGCIPPQQKIYLKEKVIERNAAPRPGIAVDRFAYGKATGPVDVLFVLDNTETADQAVAPFRHSYTQFLARMTGSEGRLMDYRVQVASTPDDRATKNFILPGTPAALHLSELFDGDLEKPPVFNGFYNGYVNPFSTTAAALSGKAFEGRPPGPLFLISLLGSDMDGSNVQETKERIQAALDARGAYQTHAWVLSRTSEFFGSGTFPHCDTFQTADQALAIFQSIQWGSYNHIDLCHKEWSSFEEDLFDSIVSFKKKLILTQRPFQPETMTVRGSSRLFRYMDDYQFDAETNEIQFLKDGVVQEGDLIEVAYYLKPNEQIFQGSPAPQPFPIQIK